jgi:hypothetical protein
MKWAKTLLAGLTGLAQGMTAERQEQYRRQQEQAAQQWQAAQIRDQQNYRQAMLNQDALRAQEERRRQEDAQQHAFEMARLQDTQQRGLLDYTQNLNEAADTRRYNTGQARATQVAQGVNAQLMPLYGNLMYGPQGMQTGTQAVQQQRFEPPSGGPVGGLTEEQILAMGQPLHLSTPLPSATVETPVMTPVGALDWSNPLVKEQFGTDYLTAGGKMQLDEYGNIMYTGQPQTPEQRAAAAQATRIDTETKLAALEKALAEAHTAAVEAENADEMAAYEVAQEQLATARAEYELAVDSGEFGLAAQAKAKIDQLYAGVAKVQSDIAHTQWAEVNPSPNVIAQGEYTLQGQREGRAYDWQKTTTRRTWEVKDAETLRLQAAEKAAAAGGTPDPALAAKIKAVSDGYGEIADIVEDPKLSEDARRKKIALVYKGVAANFTDRSHPLLQELAEAAGIGPVGGGPVQQLSNGYTVGRAGAQIVADFGSEPYGKRANQCGTYCGAYLRKFYDPNAPTYDADDYDDKYFDKSPLWQRIDITQVDDPSVLVDAVAQWDGGEKRGYGRTLNRHVTFLGLDANGDVRAIGNRDDPVSMSNLGRAKVYVYVGPGGGRQPNAAAPRASAPATPQRPTVDIGIASSGSARSKPAQEMSAGIARDRAALGRAKTAPVGSFSGAVAGGRVRGKSAQEMANDVEADRARLRRARGIK